MTNLALQLDRMLDGSSDASIGSEVVALIAIADQIRMPDADAILEVERATAVGWTRIAAGLEPRHVANASGLDRDKRRASSSSRWTRGKGVRATALIFATLLMTSSAVAATNTRAGRALRSAAHRVGAVVVSAVPGAPQPHQGSESVKHSDAAVLPSPLPTGLGTASVPAPSEPPKDRTARDAPSPRVRHRTDRSTGNTRADAEVDAGAHVALPADATDEAALATEDGDNSVDPPTDDADPTSPDPAPVEADPISAPTPEDTPSDGEPADAAPVEETPADDVPAVTEP